MKKRGAEQAPERHGLCGYSVGQTCCPLPGSVSTGGAWYCWLHAHNRPLGHDAEEDLLGIVEDQVRLRTQRRLAGHGELEELRRTLLADHPEWRRGDDEAASEYRSRMSTLCRALFRRVRERQAAA